jgi:type VI secretion system protein ImpJ
MFLQPQHFQQQDRYHEARLSQFVSLFVPFCWGIKSLTLHEPALQNFVFEIEHCELVTWDGTILRFGGDARPQNARIEPRSFEHELDPAGRPLSAYLGVRRLQQDETNLGAGGDVAAEAGEPVSGGHRRFLLREGEVRDLCAEGDQTCIVQYLGYDVRLLFDVPTSRTQDYELIKIAEVLRSPEGKGGVLSNTYIPPVIAISSSALLQNMLKEIRNLLTAKSEELAQYSRKKGGEIALGPREIGYTLMMQAVNRYVPLLHHYLESGEIHPYPTYGLLRQLVGELTTFSQGVSVLGARDGEEPLPPYRHDQLWPCFDLVTRRVKELLSELTMGPFGDIVLSYNGEVFTADLEEGFFTGDNRYYLAIRSDLTPPELFRLLQDTGKITSREDMPKLQKSFLFGLKIAVLESPPEELLMRAHYRYFPIDHRSDHWKKIQQSGNIAVYCSSLEADTDMRLVVIYGK